ncbi:MAG: hypothetical protein PSV46_21455 [Reyranella sp.]|nr:hypothetical protein [Reyranella sp.]
MRYVRSIVVATVLTGAGAACSSEPYSGNQAYRSGPYNQSGYYYANAPRPAPARTEGYYANGVYYPPSTAYPNPAPYATSDNYYASRADYYRNYQGIHGGPERTDGVRY